MADGGMAGGEALQKYLETIAAKVGSAESVRVGFLENATYPDGTPVATVAAANEFGRPDRNQPPRPFFRDVIAVGNLEWGDKLAGLLQFTGYDAEQALGLLGEGIKGELQAAIRHFDDPPLKQETIDRKGFAKPLIDTGHMLNSVDYEVNS